MFNSTAPSAVAGNSLESWEICFDEFVGKFAMLVRIAAQSTHLEFAAGLGGLYHCAALLSRCARPNQVTRYSGDPLKNDFIAGAKTNDVPVARLIGFEAKEIADGRAVVTLAVGPQHANPMGTLHGGILCDIADAAMGMAFASTLAPQESFTTVELKINFFRPVWKASLKAEGKVVRRGRTMGYLECEISDERGQLIAKAASTCLVLRGADANGR